MGKIIGIDLGTTNSCVRCCLEAFPDTGGRQIAHPGIHGKKPFILGHQLRTQCQRSWFH